MSRELDAKVAEAMGCCVEWRDWLTPGGTLLKEPFCLCAHPNTDPPPHGYGVWDNRLAHYSADIAAAWQVVEWMNIRKWRILIDNDFRKWGVQLSLKGEYLANEQAPIAPEAICLAFLRAMGVEVEE